MTSGLNSCDRGKCRKAMATWHGLEGGAIERKGRTETILGVSGFYIWLALLILIWVQTNCILWAKGRSLWKTCACTTMDLSEGTRLTPQALLFGPGKLSSWAVGLGVCAWLRNFLSTPLLLQFLLHIADLTALCSKLLKLGILNSNPNSPLTLISMNRELMEVCEDEMRHWAKALWAVPGMWEATRSSLWPTGSDQPIRHVPGHPVSSDQLCHWQLHTFHYMRSYSFTEIIVSKCFLSASQDTKQWLIHLFHQDVSFYRYKPSRAGDRALTLM